MRRTFGAVVALLLLVACADDSKTVAAFERKRDALVAATPELFAASVMYRLAETPEEQQMGQLLLRVRSHDRSAAAEATGLELARREKYIDELDSRTDKFRQRTAHLVELANSMHDKEVRASALKLCDHFVAVADAASKVARAQRDRSIWTARFLKSVENHERFSEDSRKLAEHDDAAKQGQDRINQLYEGQAQASAVFSGTWNRRRKIAFARF